MNDKENFVLKKTLSEILRGFSVFRHESSSVYIKHLNFFDYVDYEIVYDDYFNTLIRKGLETEKQLLERHIKNGLWSEKEDLELARLKEDVDNQKKTLDKIIVESQKEEIQKYLDEITKKYNLLANKKFSLTQNSCEHMTNKKMNEHYILSSLYKSQNFEEKFISEETLDDDDFDIYPFVQGYTEKIKSINLLNIKKICIRPFFRNLWDINDQNHAYHFFGSPTSTLTNYQSLLSDYAIIFGNIFKNFPEIKSDDPEKILQLAQKRVELSKKKNNKGNQTFPGMTSQEYESMGVQRPNRESLFEQALNKGGKMRIK